MELFSTRPYEDVSVDEVCAHAGVAHGLVSYHFGSKRRMFAAAVQQAWRELLDFEKPRSDEQTASAMMRGSVRRHFEYVQRHPQRFASLMCTGHADPDILETMVAARTEALAEIQAGLGCPMNPPPALRIALHGWAGLLEGMTLDYIHHHDLDIDEVVDLCVQALISAVRSADGHRYDVDVELATLDHVSGPNRARLQNADLVPYGDGRAVRADLISDELWEVVGPLMPSREGYRGRPFADHRVILEGIAWRFRTGAPWRDLPAEFGPWKTVWKRHHRFSVDGTYRRMFDEVRRRYGIDCVDVAQLLAINSSIVRAHQHAAGAPTVPDHEPAAGHARDHGERSNPPSEPDDHPLGRSRGRPATAGQPGASPRLHTLVEDYLLAPPPAPTPP